MRKSQDGQEGEKKFEEGREGKEGPRRRRRTHLKGRDVGNDALLVVALDGDEDLLHALILAELRHGEGSTRIFDDTLLGENTEAVVLL